MPPATAPRRHAGDRRQQEEEADGVAVDAAVDEERARQGRRRLEAGPGEDGEGEADPGGAPPDHRPQVRREVAHPAGTATVGAGQVLGAYAEHEQHRRSQHHRDEQRDDRLVADPVAEQQGAAAEQGPRGEHADLHPAVHGARSGSVMTPMASVSIAASWVAAKTACSTSAATTRA